MMTSHWFNRVVKLLPRFCGRRHCNLDRPFSDHVMIRIRQVEIEQCQRGLVGRESAGNRAFIDRVVTQKDLDGFHPGLIDLTRPDLLVSFA